MGRGGYFGSGPPGGGVGAPWGPTLRLSAFFYFITLSCVLDLKWVSVSGKWPKIRKWLRVFFCCFFRLGAQNSIFWHNIHPCASVTIRNQNIARLVFSFTSVFRFVKKLPHRRLLRWQLDDFCLNSERVVKNLLVIIIFNSVLSSSDLKS